MGNPIQSGSIDQEAFTDEDVLTAGPKYNEPPPKNRIKWYRCRVSRDQLRGLNRCSDFLGFVQTIGFLAVISFFAGIAIYSSTNWPWYITGILVFVNGHFWHFFVNGFHELVHDSVFRTRWLNKFFLWVYSFLAWHNHHLFWASHTEHHKYALHPPDDQEVVLPQKIDLENLWKWSVISYRYPDFLIREKIRNFTGYVNMDDTWVAALLPESDSERRRAYTNWERFMFIGHMLIAGVSIAYGHWIVLLVVTFPKMFGAWLQFLCNAAQHTGLQDKVEDYRLCCRTIYLNPVLRFLYWHMNYHTEHHMYAAVPCYKLGRLHRLIKHDMPWCPNGLRETWKHIAEIQERQECEPDYQFVAERSTRATS
ncbi:MAG: fatty acid desaturase [Gemmatimonadota bacterium]|nr:fatty acid desaturase [Gemmatimonadota bacterium]